MSSKHTNNQLRKGLQFQQNVPAFLQRIKEQVGYQDPHTSLLDKIATVDRDNDDIRAKSDQEDDDLPAIVMDGNRQLSAEEIKELRIGKPATEEPDSRPSAVSSTTEHYQNVDLGEKCTFDDPNKPAFSARPIFKKPAASKSNTSSGTKKRERETNEGSTSNDKMNSTKKQPATKKKAVLSFHEEDEDGE
jgi:hypothetical protein